MGRGRMAGRSAYGRESFGCEYRKVPMKLRSVDTYRNASFRAVAVLLRPAVSDFKGLTGMAWKDNMQHIRNLTEVFLPR